MEDILINTKDLTLYTVELAEYELLEADYAHPKLWLDRGFSDPHKYFLNNRNPIPYRINQVRKVREQFLQAFENLKINKETMNNGTSVILAGGIGSRLSDFTQVPKPFIEIKGKKLWQISNLAVSNTSNKYIIIRKEFASYLEGTDNSEVILLEKPTQGQADTARYALGKIKPNSGPLTFLSCDNVINQIDYQNAIKLLAESDLVVWTSSGYPMAKYRPNRYSWVNLGQKKVIGFSLKNLPANFSQPSMIIGNFTFKNAELAKVLINECFKSADRYSSEIYLDSVIQVALEFGYDVSAIDLERFFAIGTEDEMNTYNYYQDLKMSKNLSF
jgi:NDP-sugar pyrophosphorylase family protein